MWEFMRRGVNQRTLEKICKLGPVLPFDAVP
jgi:hypothetical protein